MMRRISNRALVGFYLFVQMVMLFGCTPVRDDSGPMEGNVTPAEPRYLCDYQMHSGSTTDCRLESEVNLRLPANGEMFMLEATRYPDMDPTPEQKKAAQELVRRCYESARAHGWYDFDKATEDGFRLKVADLTHYNNVEFLFDDHVLDPDRPEYLMFYDTANGKQLAGFMFVPRSNEEEGPQIGGPLTRWHYHLWSKPICLERGVVDRGQLIDGKCKVGSPSIRSPEMLHVWLLDHPEGSFATGMHLSPELLNSLVKEREGQEY